MSTDAPTITQTPRLQWVGQTCTLLPQRAMVWHDIGGGGGGDTLVIADPHFGKADTFRASGIPVPEGTTDAMLHRLSRLVRETRCDRLLVLGDFFHARRGVSDEVLAALSEWRQRHRSLAVVVLRGNHDRHAGDPPEQLGFDVGREEWRERGVVFRHEPPGVGEEVSEPIIAGHIHPAVRLVDAHGSIKAPCFHFGPRVAVLPAFGLFTGSHVVRPRRDDRTFAVGPSSVIEVGGQPLCAHNDGRATRPAGVERQQ